MNVYAEVGGSGSRKPIAVPETAGAKGSSNSSSSQRVELSIGTTPVAE